MDDRVTVTICGDGGCGKSSITLRIVRSQWTHEYDPTIEDSYSVNRTIDGTTYSLSITDTAGQEEYRGMWSAANLASDAFLLVYDITNTSSLQQLEFFTEMIEVERDARMENGRCWPAIMVAGNKCDLQSSRQVGARDGLEWAKLRGCGFMETSAREMVNIEETFSALVRRVVESRKQHAAGLRPDFPSLTAPVPQQAQAQSPNIQQTSAPPPAISQYTDKSILPSQPEAPQQELRKISSFDNEKQKKGFLSSLKCW